MMTIALLAFLVALRHSVRCIEIKDHMAFVECVFQSLHGLFSGDRSSGRLLIRMWRAAEVDEPIERETVKGSSKN